MSANGVALALSSFMQVEQNSDHVEVPEQRSTVFKDLTSLSFQIQDVARRFGLKEVKTQVSEDSQRELSVMQGSALVGKFAKDDYPSWQGGLQKLLSSIGLKNATVGTVTLDGEEFFEITLPAERYPVTSEEWPSFCRELDGALFSKGLAFQCSAQTNGAVLKAVHLPTQVFAKKCISFDTLVEALVKQRTIFVSVTSSWNYSLSIDFTNYIVLADSIEKIRALLADRGLSLHIEHTTSYETEETLTDFSLGGGGESVWTIAPTTKRKERS